jgi:hypothetical protein
MIIEKIKIRISSWLGKEKKHAVVEEAMEGAAA